MSRASINSSFIYHTHKAIHLFLIRGPHFLLFNSRSLHPIHTLWFSFLLHILHDCNNKEHLNMGGKANGTTSSKTSSVSATVTTTKQKLLGGQSLQISSPGTASYRCTTRVEQHKSTELCGILIKIKIYPVVP